MTWRGVLARAGACATVLGVAGSVVLSGCSSVDQIQDTTGYSTLTVAYNITGPTPGPCDDRLPMVDGVAEDQEWDVAEPLYVRMSGDNGTGGDDYFVEVRAVWTDESRFSGGTDRVYFLVRYADNDQDNQADLLAYGKIGPSGEIIPSPVPEEDTSVNPPVPDPVILDPDSWTRLNPNGREDQIAFLIGEEPSGGSAGLVDVNREVLGKIGVETPTGVTLPGAANLDLWIWRATRTNGQPVPQFARWGDFIPGAANPSLGQCDVPEPETSAFPNNSGFCEDLWINGSGSLVADGGRPPYVKNFVTRDPVPDRITEAIPSSRDPADETLIINCNLPKDILLWWPTARIFKVTDDICTSRIGAIRRRWSERLLPGEFDKIQGWALQTPTGSSRDVRARAVFDENQDKGFPVRTLEVMRELNTGNADDLKIEPGKAYRLVIGIYDASGVRASGSTEIRLLFEPPVTSSTRPRNRC